MSSRITAGQGGFNRLPEVRGPGESAVQGGSPQLGERHEQEGAAGLGLKRPRSEQDNVQFTPATSASEPQWGKKPRVQPPTLAEFHAAIERGDEDAVRAALQQHAMDLSACDESGQTPLMRAVAKAAPNMVQLIWRAMSTLPESLKIKEAAFFHAVQTGQVEIVQYMARECPSIVVATEPKNGRAAMHLVCEAGNEAMVSTLLQLRSGVLHKDAKGNTPFMLAAQSRQCALLPLLLGKGAKESDLNANGNNVLAAAMLNRDYDVVETLLRAGCRQVISGTSPSPASIEALAWDLHSNAADLMGKFGIPSSELKSIPFPEATHTWLCELAQSLFPFDGPSAGTIDLDRAMAPELDSLIHQKWAVLHMAHANLAEVLSHFARLCVALTDQQGQAFDPKNRGQMHAWRTTPAQREQVLAGLLADLFSHSADIKNINESTLSGPVKHYFTARLAWQVEGMQTAAKATRTARLEQLGRDITELVIDCLTFECEFSEMEFRSEVSKRYGLFLPVTDLLVDAIQQALAICGKRTLALTGDEKLGALQEASGAEYGKFAQELPGLFQLWDADLDLWEQEKKDPVLQKQRVDSLQKWEQAKAEWSPELRKIVYLDWDEPKAVERKYAEPPSFIETLGNGLRQLGPIDRHEAYSELVFGQWAAVRKALCKSYPALPVQPDASQSNSSQSNSSQSTSAAQTPVVIDNVVRDLDLDFFNFDWDS